MQKRKSYALQRLTLKSPQIPNVPHKHKDANIHIHEYIHFLHTYLIHHPSSQVLPEGSTRPMLSKLSLSHSVSPPASPNLLVHTHPHQYARDASMGFKHTGWAAQISVLILMGRGLRVQLQVTLRVAQEVGGIGKSPWK